MNWKGKRKKNVKKQLKKKGGNYPPTNHFVSLIDFNTNKYKYPSVETVSSCLPFSENIPIPIPIPIPNPIPLMNTEKHFSWTIWSSLTYLAYVGVIVDPAVSGQASVREYSCFSIKFCSKMYFNEIYFGKILLLLSFLFSFVEYRYYWPECAKNQKW